MMKIKKYFLSVALLFLALTVQASGSDAAEVIYENDFVKVERITSICKSNQGFDYKYALLKFTNLTSGPINIAYNMTVQYDTGKEVVKDGDIIMYELSIPANGTVEGSCEKYYNKQLAIFDHSLTAHPNAFKGRLVGININELKAK